MTHAPGHLVPHSKAPVGGPAGTAANLIIIALAVFGGYVLWKGSKK